MSSWAKTIVKVGRDSWNLTRLVVVEYRNSRSKDNVRSLLLDQARQANTVAHGFLKVDKEVGLMKYYGLLGYMKRYLQGMTWFSRLTSSQGDGGRNATIGGNPSSTSSSLTTTEENGGGLSSSSSSSSSEGNDVGTTAKIAFMVTASMKQELSEGLGYTMDQIKTMTPLQASLILNERISPQDMEIRLPIAEEAYASAARKRQQDEEEARKIQAQTTTLVGTQASPIPHPPPPSAATAATTSSTTTMITHDTQHFGVGLGYYHSRNDFAFQQEGTPSSSTNDNTGSSTKEKTFFDTSEWYEVVEIDEDDGSITRVGLYLDEDEATLGMLTRKEVTEARNKNRSHSNSNSNKKKKTNTKFEIRRISPSSVDMK